MEDADKQISALLFTKGRMAFFKVYKHYNIKILAVAIVVNPVLVNLQSGYECNEHLTM